jgi:hypothetical protein
MFAIMEYVWKIRGQLKKDAPNYEQILKLLGDTENRMWNKIRRMQLQVKRCQYAKRERCEMCRVLLEEEGEQRLKWMPKSLRENGKINSRQLESLRFKDKKF